MYYIYKTTNLKNGKIYIGFHRSDNIDSDPYLGSGVLINKAIKKYGREFFKRDILFKFETIEEALLQESLLVNHDFLSRTDVYNLVTGGRGGVSTEGIFNKGKIGICLVNENRNAYIDKEDLNEYLNKGWELGSLFKGRVTIRLGNQLSYCGEDELEEYLGKGWVQSSSTHHRKCITHIESNTLKYVNAEDLDYYLTIGFVESNMKSGINKDRIYISKNQKNKRIRRDELEDYIKDGWVESRYQREIKIRRMHHPVTNQIKNIPLDKIDEFIKLGWCMGTNMKSANIGDHHRGKIYVNKNSVAKRITSSELKAYQDDGWEVGRGNLKSRAQI